MHFVSSNREWTVVAAIASVAPTFSTENVGLRVASNSPLRLRSSVPSSVRATPDSLLRSLLARGVRAIARIFWSLTVVGRRESSWIPTTSSTARKNWASQGQTVKTHSDERSKLYLRCLPRLLGVLRESARNSQVRVTRGVPLAVRNPEGTSIFK